MVDADTFIYRAAAASEKAIEWEPDFWTYDANLADARAIFRQSVSDLVEIVNDQLNDGSVVIPVICLSDASGNFRNDISETYKANRGKRPMLYGPLREWVMEEYPEWTPSSTEPTHCIRPRLEADDILGILGTSPSNRGVCVLYSEDKDLRQIPGFHVGKVGLETVTEEEGELFFMTQILTGDSVDNYPGCPGIGPVKAGRLLEASTDHWPTIVEAYTKAGLTEGDALIQARQARILQYTDYDFKKKEPILWNPPVKT